MSASKGPAMTYVLEREANRRFDTLYAQFADVFQAFADFDRSGFMDCVPIEDFHPLVDDARRFLEMLGGYRWNRFRRLSGGQSASVSAEQGPGHGETPK